MMTLEELQEERDAYKQDYYKMLEAWLKTDHEIKILRACVKHLIAKHDIEEPKINGIPLSEWTVDDSIRTVTLAGDEEE